VGGRTHRYQTHLTWIGGGAASLPFRDHDRSYRLDAPGKPAIPGSSDKVFRGDERGWNPEDLLVASLSACHHLWYMGLCAAAGIVVLAYEDAAEGEMVEQSPGGAGQFVRVTLRPRVTLAPGSDREKALALHEPPTRTVSLRDRSTSLWSTLRSSTCTVVLHRAKAQRFYSA
jgi:organic hydroperoxide reductase OsmC/OhrA